MFTSSFRSIILLGISVLCVLAIDRAAAGLFQILTKNSHDRFSRLYFAPPRAEVAIFGNSRAIHSLHAPTIERVLHRTTVSFAANGLDAKAVGALVMDAADQIPSLKLAIIEVSAIASSGSGNLSLQPFAGKSMRLNDLLQEQHAAIIPWQNIFRSARISEDRLFRMLRHLRQGDQEAINRGSRTTPKTVAAFMRAWQVECRPAADEVEPLRRAAAHLRSNGVGVIFVSSPYHPGVWQAPGFCDWPNYAQDILGGRFIDLSRALQADRFFADPIHGNISSALIVADHLKPHAGLAKVSAW